MALIEAIALGSNIAFDTDALIYYVEEHDQFLPVVEPAIDRVARGQAVAHISVITFLEVLVRPLREQRHDLVDRYRGILLDPANFTMHPVSSVIAERAASIRAEHNVEVADAIIAATAIAAGCDFLVTNNGGDFRKIVGFQTLVIRDYV